MGELKPSTRLVGNPETKIFVFWVRRRELQFEIQEGATEDWLRIVDTGLQSPGDLSECGVPVVQLPSSCAPIPSHLALNKMGRSWLPRLESLTRAAESAKLGR